MATTITWTGWSISARNAAGPGGTVYPCLYLGSEPQSRRIRSRLGRKEAGSGPYSCTWIKLPATGYTARGQGAKIFLGDGSLYDGYSQDGKTYWCGEIANFRYIETRGTWSNGKWSGNVSTTDVYVDGSNRVFYTWTKFVDAPGEPFQYTDTQGRETGAGSGYFAMQKFTNLQLTPRPSHGDVNNISFVPLENVIGTDIQPRSLDRWLSKAYTDAISSLPWTTMNNIANIIDTAGMFANILGGRLDSVGSISDLWLGYRYVYNTTKMDVSEAVEIVDRLSVFDRTPEVTCNSVVHTEGYTIRCAATLSSDSFKGARSFAQKWGVQLSAYNAWDMVPYSFIVDWFLDVGNKLEYYEGWGYAVKLRPSTNVWFSISDERKYEGARVSRFYRWTARPPVSTPVYTKYAPKSKTLIQRGIDLIALFG